MRFAKVTPWGWIKANKRITRQKQAILMQYAEYPRRKRDYNRRATMLLIYVALGYALLYGFMDGVLWVASKL